MRLPKPYHVLLGALLLAVTSLGYWIGRISSQDSPQVIQQESALHMVQSQQHFQKKPKNPDKPLKLFSPKESNVLSEDKIVKNKMDINSVSQEKPTFSTKPVGVAKTVAYQNKQKTEKPKGQSMQNTSSKAKSVIWQSLAQKKTGVQPDRFNRPNLSQKQKKKSQMDLQPDPGYYCLMHGGQAAKIHGKIHEHLRTISEHVPKKHYIFTNKSIPSDPRMRPSIANGHLGTAVHGEEVYMNGLYNGRGNETHRAAIPSTCSLNITDTDPPTKFTRTCTLNVAQGMYYEQTKSSLYNITHRIFAHRTLNRLLVVEIDLVRKEAQSPLKLKVELNKWTASFDLTFHRGDTTLPETSYKIGIVNAPEKPGYEEPSEVHVLYDHVPDELVPPSGVLRTKWVFLTAIAPTKQECFDAYQQGSKLAKSNDQLYALHVEAWAHLWANGSINVIGNDKLGKAIYGSFYYILSSLPLQSDLTWPFIGLSPSGLPFGQTDTDYQGHVFWDQETWMYPPILMMYPDLAALILETRNRTKVAAASIAKAHGKQGLQYPWESAFTGDEVCPDPEIAKREIHVTGDIAVAVTQYLQATGNTSILDRGFLDILAGIAKYWVTNLQYNASLNMYTILNVIPPDEYQKQVNNSVYTNMIAKKAIEAPMLAQRRQGHINDHWKEFLNIYIPFDRKLQYHPEFDGYKEGTKVKQADTILLGYPLQANITDAVRRNDLTAYAKVTDIGGPAMSWSMFATNWLRLGETEKAENFFLRNFQFIKNEFQVWHETSFGKGATNFITGMGGFLQMIVFGYGGLELSDTSLHIKPTLPPNCSQLHIMNFNYQGSAFNLFVERDSYKVILTHRDELGPVLKLRVDKTERTETFQLNRPITVSPIQPATISRSLFFSLEES